MFGSLLARKHTDKNIPASAGIFVLLLDDYGLTKIQRGYLNLSVVVT